MKESRGKIMLVEDNQHLKNILKDYLETIKFRVDDFSDGIAALEAFSQYKYDICIFDIVMQGMTGFELIQEIRKKDEDIPVIFLTARNEKEDKIKAFKLGCDDYITKPFSTEEFVLRIEAILRRTRRQKARKPAFNQTPQTFEFGKFVFDTASLELRHPSKTRLLTRKEAELLRIFCENPNKLIPRDYILRHVWGTDDYATSRSMDVFLAKIRNYLNIDNKPDIEPDVEIKNVHGSGFILKVKN